MEEYSSVKKDTDAKRPSNPSSMEEPKIKEFFSLSHSDKIARKDSQGLAQRLSSEVYDVARLA